MKKLLCVILLLLATSTHASSFGYFYGKHFPEDGLNNSHPFIEFGNSVMVYQNSFDKVGVAVYQTFKKSIFSVRLGITTGYKEKMQYKGKTYTSFFTFNDLTPVIIPAIQILLAKEVSVAVAILGNSANIGIVKDF